MGNHCCQKRKTGMNKLAFVIVLFLTITFSCKKTVVSIRKSDLEGSWALKRISGGFAGIDSVVTEDNTITFGSNGNYTGSRDNVIIATGNYNLAKANDPYDYGSETLLNIVFNNGDKITYGITLHNDSLSLGYGCCDQFGYLYVRKK